MSDLIAHNVKCIRNRLFDAAQRAGRQDASIRLVGVTKTVTVTEIKALYDLGIRDFGENRPEHAIEKITRSPHDICWHMIGNIQSKKAGDVVSVFHVADGIDRIKVAQVLQKRCEEMDKTLEILLEINVSGETTKHGFRPEDVPEALRELRAYDRLYLTGLMTMAPWNAPESIIRACFRQLNAMADDNGLPERSMGMTDDFEIAIEEGSTQVRIGRALFETP